MEVQPREKMAFLEALAEESELMEEAVEAACHLLTNCHPNPDTVAVAIVATELYRAARVRTPKGG